MSSPHAWAVAAWTFAWAVVEVVAKTHRATRNLQERTFYVLRTDATKPFNYPKPLNPNAIFWPGRRMQPQSAPRPGGEFGLSPIPIRSLTPQCALQGAGVSAVLPKVQGCRVLESVFELGNQSVVRF